MSFAHLRFEASDSLLINDGVGGSMLWLVIARKRDGYLMRPPCGADDRTWSMDEIAAAYLEGRIEHFKCDKAGLPLRLGELLDRTWEYWPEEYRLEAERREAYVLRVDQRVMFNETLEQAYAKAADEVYERNVETWQRETNDLAAVRRQEVQERRRKPRPVTLFDEEARLITKPSTYAIRDWYANWKATGGRIEGLIPSYHKRGNRRPRYTNAEKIQTLMEEVAEAVFVPTRPPRTRAYEWFKDKCQAAGLTPVSFKTFSRFLKGRYSDFEEFKLRYGPRAAYLKFHIFERTKLPDAALDEVEIDHCLLDMFVRLPNGRSARPWLTAIIDRATKCILGYHISFEKPSYAATQRAIAHALCAKDLSGVEGIEHDWPCHGVFNWLVTDQGKDLKAKSLVRAGRDIGFEVINLPGMMPWLKGTIERLFREIGVQVLSFEEGATKARSKGFYDPAAQAKMTLEELNLKLLKWIVDDYHQKKHSTTGDSPITRWRALTRSGVRPIGSFSRLMVLIGESVTRKISNVGIQIAGLLYASPELERLRHRRGGLKKSYSIRFDPYDLGECNVLDQKFGTWLPVPCADPEIARGVTKFQHKVHVRVARELAAKGETITAAHIQNAKRYTEDETRSPPPRRRAAATAANVARYQANGAFSTPILGGMDDRPTLIVSRKAAVEPAPHEQHQACSADASAPPNVDPSSGLASLVQILSATRQGR